MIALLNRELTQMTEKTKVDVEFIMVAVDFIHTYADGTHHGKEEDILFRELSQEHKKTMNELVEEHVSGRKMVASLVNAIKGFEESNLGATQEITTFVKELVNFYPAHIEKEDKHFFYSSLENFSQQGQDDMLQEFWEFDRKLIHEKYEKIIEGIEKETA